MNALPLIPPLLNIQPAMPLVFGFLAMPFVAMALLVAYRTRLAGEAGVARDGLFTPPMGLFLLALLWVLLSLMGGFYHFLGLPVLIVWAPLTAWRLLQESRRIGAPQVGAVFAAWLMAATLLGEGLYLTAMYEGGNRAITGILARSRFITIKRDVALAHQAHLRNVDSLAPEQLVAKALAQPHPRQPEDPATYFYTIRHCPERDLADACYVAWPLRPAKGSVPRTQVDASSDPFIWREGGPDAGSASGEWPFCSLEWPPLGKTPCPDHDLLVAAGNSDLSFVEFFAESRFEEEVAPPAAATPD